LIVYILWTKKQLFPDLCFSYSYSFLNFSPLWLIKFCLMDAAPFSKSEDDNFDGAFFRDLPVQMPVTLFVPILQLLCINYSI
jgi:hypothetical protein